MSSGQWNTDHVYKHRANKTELGICTYGGCKESKSETSRLCEKHRQQQIE